MAETVGSLVDKLSIVELKIYHMAEQAERADATAEFRERCVERLAILLTAMVDGLWLELSLDPASFGADAAAAMIEQALTALLPPGSSPH